MTKSLMKYLAAKIVGNEDWANRVLPTLDIDETSRNIQRCWIKADTHALLHLFNMLKSGDLCIDEDMTQYRYKTPWDMYAMTIQNTIEPKPQTPLVENDIGVLFLDELEVTETVKEAL